MDSRREFIKKATALATGAGISQTLPASVQKAFSINPVQGSTYLDAEHVVILMQENRSFDHCYGSLQGVRGFNDPRALSLNGGNRVWLQKNDAGETYIPFRLNMKETRATWMGSLPHSRASQVDARNGGKCDKWLIAKKSNNINFAKAPLSLGFYNREDIPFYYALADAFTICDQNFSSSLTGTTPNRLYLWTGTIREKYSTNTHANLRNEDVNENSEASWITFPERLEDNNISWKIYQNELNTDSGLTVEEDEWLANFSDNPMEWFSQYHVRFAKSHREHLHHLFQILPGKIAELEEKLKQYNDNSASLASIEKQLNQQKELFQKVSKEKDKWTVENFEKLTQRQKNLHTKAFTVNSNDPDYRKLGTFKYQDENEQREVKLPKGDVLYQFRNDVEHGNLPTVSWIVAPENFSDHPDAPWYGAWYVSEVMDILTKDPEVWKKTIFILCYDENDGYFDHIPPFTPYDPAIPGTGAASPGIDTSPEHVTLAQDSLFQKKANHQPRASTIGLGYRVPMVIASPWSRGGMVCSQVFDHTSVLQLLETFVSHKAGKKITETNIGPWRRAVCGNLSSVFRPYNGEKISLPSFLKQDTIIESIHRAKFKRDPFGYKALTQEEIEQINDETKTSSLMPAQEPGTREACPIPYELYVQGELNNDKTSFDIRFKAANEIFGAASAGAPFIVYAPEKHIALFTQTKEPYETGRNWNYAVSPGDTITDRWPLNNFIENRYFLTVYGPNGFFRSFKGDAEDPDISITFEYERRRMNSKSLTGNIILTIENNSPDYTHEIVIENNAYNTARLTRRLTRAGSPEAKKVIVADLSKNHGWYDFTLKVDGNNIFNKRYAGHVETGNMSRTDPFMGRV